MKYWGPNAAATAPTSKAHSLARLAAIQLIHARVPDLTYFSVDEWARDRRAIVSHLQHYFGEALLAVRSSAWDEGGVGESRAGQYLSCLNVPSWNENALQVAVCDVIQQYDERPDNVVLVQAMVTHARAFGAASTYGLSDGAPYLTISYDLSARPAIVTAGLASPTTAVVYRDAGLQQVKSPDVRAILAAAGELEAHFDGVPLEFEFALTPDGRPLILQVRPFERIGTLYLPGADPIAPMLASLADTVDRLIASSQNLCGARTILGNMPDWNPAELIGVRPRPLALSIYDTLITQETWRRARAMMGYRAVADSRLLVDLLGRPYVDVRASFNSFLPDGLDDDTSSVLVDAWLDRLECNASLHDKVEFEVALTCIDFDFERAFSERYGRLLPNSSLTNFRDLLGNLTRRCLAGQGPGSLAEAASELRRLCHRQMKWTVASSTGRPSVEHLQRTLNECRAFGTLPFACAARHAFIAEALLRSAIRRGALTPNRAQQLRRSIRTVRSNLADDRRRLRDGALSEPRFFSRYGHLRPGTYDIRSPRYADMPEVFKKWDHDCPSGRAPRTFSLTQRESSAMNCLLNDADLDCVDGAGLLLYLKRAIRLREHAKFVFTRHVSVILESIADWGEGCGFDRNEMSYLEVEDLETVLARPRHERRALARELLDESTALFHAADAIRLSPLIVRAEDVYCFTHLPSVPNFVGNGRVRGPVVRLHAGPKGQDVRDRIVCAESADPGFDWIFDQGVGGLVTQFGGPSSHMAVRCAEAGLPAALGCGETMYRYVSSADELLLDCEAQVLLPIGTRREKTLCA